MKRKTPPAPAPVETAPAPARRRAFLAITLLAPLLLLLGVEAALRLAGIGALEPLFIPVPKAEGHLQPNPAAVQRFFPDPRRAPEVSIDTTWFPAEKAPGTLRIFVQGESSAAGFPYGRWASPAALLQQRLQRAYPEREVEVINTGMAAVTSYVLLDFAEEILAQRPDAVVIYTGHNEFLGIGGVGSSLASASSPALARTIATLRRLHLYRALERGLGSFGTGADPLAARDGTLMSKVAAERSIPLGSPHYERGLGQFRGNLDRLLARYQAAGIPVFIGTLASNERDQAPFASGDDPADSARARFERGRALEAAGDYAAARTEYLAAKDRDELRFRAPEDFNQVIRAVAEARGATVVDVQGALAAASSNGIIGAGLMLEHVHPNVDGYFRLASAYFPALVRWLGPPAVAVDEAIARREIPVTAVDRLHGEYRVAALLNDWPFVPERRPTTLPAPADRVEEIAQSWFAGRLGWIEAMNEALAWYQQQGNNGEAARVAANLAEAFVTSAEAQAAAGRLLLKANEPARGQRFLRRAVTLDGGRIETLLSLAQSQFMQGNVVGSIATLEAALKQHPGDSRVTYWLEEDAAGSRLRVAAFPGSLPGGVAPHGRGARAAREGFTASPRQYPGKPLLGRRRHPHRQNGVSSASVRKKPAIAARANGALRFTTFTRCHTPPTMNTRRFGFANTNSVLVAPSMSSCERSSLVSTSQVSLTVSTRPLRMWRFSGSNGRPSTSSTIMSSPPQEACQRGCT
jgi:lysophospholipase L1-like esterase